MRNVLVILFALFTLCFVLLLGVQRVEGFAQQEGNYVLNLVAQLKRTSAALANPSLWSERMALMGKSPTELARDYIRKQKAREE
jgi:hypothetical protein